MDTEIDTLETMLFKIQMSLMVNLPKKVFIWAYKCLFFGKKTTAQCSMLHSKVKGSNHWQIVPQISGQRLSCREIRINFWLGHWDLECPLRVKTNALI